MREVFENGNLIPLNTADLRQKPFKYTKRITNMIPQIPQTGSSAGYLVFLLLGLIFSTFFLWIGTKLARIHNASLGKAVIAALVSIIALAVIRAVISYIPLLGGFIGFILGILVSIYIIKAIYGTSWGKAFLAWILYILAIIVALIIAAVLGVILFFSFF